MNVGVGIAIGIGFVVTESIPILQGSSSLGMDPAMIRGCVPHGGAWRDLRLFSGPSDAEKRRQVAALQSALRAQSRLNH